MAGELLTLEWQVELDGMLLGAGTDVLIAEEGIGGLGVPAPKTSDVELAHADGAWLGTDLGGTRVVTVPFFIAATPHYAAQLFDELAALWAPKTATSELHMLLPGFGHLWVRGRPRGLVDDLSRLRSGVVTALGTFFCGDPTIYRADS